MLLELGAYLLDNLANARAELALLQVALEELLFRLPEGIADAFVDAHVAPNGEVVRLFSDVKQYGIALLGIVHAEELKNFCSALYGMIAVAEVLHKEAYFAASVLFSIANGLHNAGFLFGSEEHARLEFDLWGFFGTRGGLEVGLRREAQHASV